MSAKAFPDPRPIDDAARRRDRYRHAATAMTGLAVAGSLTATGWVAGQAAHAWSAQQDPAPTTTTPGPAVGVPQPAANKTHRQPQRPRVVLRQRPTRTRVSTQYVTAPAPVGGGSVGSSSSHQSHSSPPAPSSGS